MSDPIEDYPGMNSSKATDSSKNTGEGYADVTKSKETQSDDQSQGGFSAFEKLLGKDNYKRWLNTFNTAVVQNIKSDREREEKVAKQLKASTEGGDIWSA